MKSFELRKNQYNYLCNKLSCMSDVSLLNLLSTWKSGHRGIGGVSILGEIDSNPVFVKRIPLTSFETTVKNYRNTANIFHLPLCFQYGIGSLGFGAWRELASHIITSNWVLTDLCPNFPIMYHWRVLPDTANNINVSYWQDDAGYLDYWENNKAITKRLSALRASKKSIFIFLEYFPKNLSEYLKDILKSNANEENKTAILQNIFTQFTDVNNFMKTNNFLHMDAHLDNVLIDNGNLYLSDFGLSMSAFFNLSAQEKSFMQNHQEYDNYSSDCFLVHGVLANYIGDDNWDEKLNNYLQDNSNVPNYINNIISNKLDRAVKMNKFYKSIQKDKSSCLYLNDSELRQDI